MAWLEEALDRLARQPVCGYVAGGDPFSEPTALAALALVAQGRHDAALAALGWLAEVQSADGSVGLNPTEPWPTWPTSLALIAWLAADAASIGRGQVARFRAQSNAAVQALLALAGRPIPLNDATQHNTTLVGWPWVVTTHSWLEPTAWAVLALRAAGEGDHPRVREGVSLLVDRLLPEGGANYGNTFVLGQELRPQVATTGLAMLALAGEEIDDPRIAGSLDYLARSLGPREAALSLAWGLQGLAAHRMSPAESNAWLAAAGERTLDAGGDSVRLAALALAELDDRSPLVSLPQTAEAAP